MPWRSMRSMTAASISAPPAARSTAHPMAAIPGAPSRAICPRCCRWKYRPCAEGTRAMSAAVIIRVILPYHLRNLARVSGEVALEVAAQPVTIGAALDALEARFPNLRGTIRDHDTLKRRPFIRYFACKEDLSFEPP